LILLIRALHLFFFVAVKRQEELRENLRQLAEALASAERADLSPQSAKSPKSPGGEKIFQRV